MDDFDIKDPYILYKRITPCLNSKIRELKKNNINYIKKDDIWNYLKRVKWKDGNPSLDIIVDDILNADNNEIDNYVKEKMRERNESKDVEIL